MNNILSVWDGNKITRRRPGSSIYPSFVTFEFPRTYTNKILSYNLGKIDFQPKPVDLNSSRNEVIDRFKDQRKSSGEYKFSSISNVFVEKVQIVPNSLGEYTILSHGVPIKNTTKENCTIDGLYCLSGEGTDRRCNSGKCVIGSILKKSKFSWEYSSTNVYGQELEPLTYSLVGTKSITLSNILRGTYEGISIDSPASRYIEVYLPPINYITKFLFEEQVLRDTKIFTEDKLKVFTEDHYKTAQSNLIGINDPKPLFIGKVLTGTYPGKSEGAISLILKQSVTDEIVEYIISNLDELPSIWIKESEEIIRDQRELSSNTFEFLSILYDRLFESYQNILLQAKSSIRKSKVVSIIDDLSRPIYSRLPGLSESYYKNPESDEEPVAKWLTSGADEFLVKTKDSIAAFYYDYLDPDTCNPIHLDWLAQHIGLFGELWNTSWEKEIKIAVIKNTYGWWDRNSTENIPGMGDVRTTKGEALDKFPFTSSMWTDNKEDDNSESICLYESETIRALESDPTTIVEYYKFKEKKYDIDSQTFSLTPTNSLKFYKENWNGLIEAKGTFMSIAFLSSLFGLKSHTPEELKILKAEVKTRILPDGSIEKFIGNKVISPKSGLRASESLAPPLFPYKSEMIQLGDSNDAEIGNYKNQLVAGISRSASYENSRNLFFRLPYYYNRNGRSWKKVEYITKNWIPSNINSRVQYAYLSADLWAVGDAFFEPEIEIKEI